MSGSVLLGGGTGFIGNRVAQILRSSGTKVQIITRKPNGSADQITWETIKKQGLPKDITSVVNLAGVNLFESFWTESFKKQVRDSRIQTNLTLVDAIHKSQTKPESFITVSGVGFYEPSEIVEYDENWQQPKEPHKLDFFMKLSKDWEASSELDEKKALTTRRVVIRSGVVMGNGGMLKNLGPIFKLGLGGPIGFGKQWLPWIHIDDIANLFVFAINSKHVTGVINGVSYNQVTNRDFSTALGRAYNKPAVLPVPPIFVKALYGRDRSVLLLNGQRVKSRASKLGFRYKYPSLDEALTQYIAASK